MLGSSHFPGAARRNSNNRVLADFIVINTLLKASRATWTLISSTVFPARPLPRARAMRYIRVNLMKEICSVQK